MLKRLEQFSATLLPVSVIAFIFVSILLPKIPLSDVPGTYIKIRIDDFVNILMVFIWGIGLWWGKKKFWQNVFTQTIVLYWFVGFVSTVSAILITQVVSENLVILSWLRRIEYMIFFFVGFAATPTISHAIKYFSALFLSTFLAVIYGLGQVVLGWCSVSTTNREFSKGECVPITRGARPNSTFGGHYDLAIFLGFLVPIVIASFFTVKQYWQKFLMVTLFFGTFGMLVLSQSRTAVVAAMLTIVVLLWFYGKRLWLLIFSILAVLVITFAGQSLVTRYITTFQLLLNPPKTEQALPIPIEQLIYETTSQGLGKVGSGSAILGQENLPTEEEYRMTNPTKYGVVDPALEARLSNQIRFQVEWPAALRAFYRNPLLGSGYSAMGTLFADQFGFATDNDYLRMLGETGLLGILSFALIFVAYFRLAYFYLKSSAASRMGRGMALGFTAGVVGFLANAVFIDVFESSKLAIFFWLFMGIVVSVMQTELTEGKKSQIGKS